MVLLPVLTHGRCPPTPIQLLLLQFVIMTGQPQYQLRARFHGALDWTCCWCGNLNRSRINRTQWKVRCKAKPCRRSFAIGMAFHSMAGVQHAGRPHLPPGDVTFPTAELDFWKSGAPVNRLINDDPQEAQSGDSD